MSAGYPASWASLQRGDAPLLQLHDLESLTLGSNSVAIDAALVQFADLSTIPSSGELKAVRWLSS
jgi:hypothetical protein